MKRAKAEAALRKKRDELAKWERLAALPSLPNALAEKYSKCAWVLW